MYYNDDGKLELSSSELLDVIDAVPLAIRSYEINNYIVYVDKEKGCAKLKFPNSCLSHLFNVVSISVKIKVEVPPDYE